MAEFFFRQSEIEIRNRKWLRVVAIVVTFPFGGVAVEAQQPTRILRIGILLASSGSFYLAQVEAFRQRQRELGYVEGKNILIEYRRNRQIEKTFGGIAKDKG